jgi:hypothetical protein
MRTFILLLLCINVLAAKEIKLNLTITDSNGKELADAKCIAQFNKPDSKKSEIITQSSDSHGEISFVINSREDLYLEVYKDNYYSSRIYDLSTQQDLKQIIKLREKVNPIALYVKYHSGNQSEGLKFPKMDQWYEYDLKMGDWVQPQGKGVTANFKMRLHCEQQSLAHSYLEIETIEELAGFFITNDLNEYSELRLPNRAPEGDYVKSITIPADEWENYRGIFLRTRVETDKEKKFS